MYKLVVSYCIPLGSPTSENQGHTDANPVMGSCECPETTKKPIWKSLMPALLEVFLSPQFISYQGVDK